MEFLRTVLSFIINFFKDYGLIVLPVIVAVYILFQSQMTMKTDIRIKYKNKKDE